MKFLADLHIHSKFSRATSKEMELEIIARWAKIKGISLIATGDFTHPEWSYLIKEKLEPLENGFLKLKDPGKIDNPFLRQISFSVDDVNFIISGELSFIYSKNGQVRRIHIIVLVPDLLTAELINKKIENYGKLSSDGRPMLGMDAKNFLSIILSISPRSIVIPAHIWTPWFSLFGANSGFDSIEECFEDISDEIFVLETGLSSDPSMNWRLSSLDRFTLTSNSDAHSPSKIGREMNLFDTEFSYQGVREAIKLKNPKKFLYTIEFFPEEGKYHYDGHKNCKVCLSPKESIKKNLLCPVCSRKLTIGVMHRVEALADREENYLPEGVIPYKNLIPLNEIIGEAMEKSSESPAVYEEYFRLINIYGNEFNVLNNVPISSLEKSTSERISQGISNMREGKVSIFPGFDGVYGKISLFERKEEQKAEEAQLKLF
ncbi:MAG: endonuclease Q family protein [Acidobacteriota bacterium]